jgi:uncharacterized membrane protein
MDPVLAAFVGHNGFFGALLTLHVMGAIVGLGPTFAFPILAAMGKKATPEGGLTLLESTLGLEKKLINPILMTVQPITGVLLIWNRGLNVNFFSGKNLWLIVGILAYVAATVIALRIFDPALEKMIKLGRAGQGDTPEFGVLGAKLDKIGPVLGVLAVIIMVMMIWKPGSGCGALYRC